MLMYQGVSGGGGEKSALAKFLCRAWKLVLSLHDQYPSLSTPGISWLKKVGKTELDLVGPPTRECPHKISASQLTRGPRKLRGNSDLRKSCEGCGGLLRK